MDSFKTIIYEMRSKKCAKVRIDKFKLFYGAFWIGGYFYTMYNIKNNIENFTQRQSTVSQSDLGIGTFIRESKGKNFCCRIFRW